MDRKIVLTGGGTAGHVMVNMALIPRLKDEGWKVDYIGSKNGIEKQLMEKVEGVHYHAISTGKFRRYFDLKNIKDPFKVLTGILQAYFIFKKVKPQVVFSKGGFVSVPVILGARLARVPSIIHESDLTPGLANKIAMPFASKICVTFPETLKYIDANKGVYVGAIIRNELFHGDIEKGLTLGGFIPNKPIILVMGGSSGARKINEAVRKNLDVLLKDYQIIHICGKGNIDGNIEKEGYKQFEYVNEELPDLLKTSAIIISRAGSNAIFEFLALKKPMLLIPLSKASSRGDQIDNAKSFEKAGFADILYEEQIDQNFVGKINTLYQNRFQYIDKMNQENSHGRIDQVMEIIKEVSTKK